MGIQKKSFFFKEWKLGMNEPVGEGGDGEGVNSKDQP